MASNLHALAGLEHTFLVGQREAQLALEDPADLGVVVVDSGRETLELAGAVPSSATTFGEADLAELELAGTVRVLRAAVGEGIPPARAGRWRSCRRRGPGG